MFVRTTCHEIRTPLNTVNMGLDLIKKDLLRLNCEEDSLQTLRDVKHSCQDAVAQLSDMLLYEKFEVGLVTLDKLRVQAWTFLSDAVEPFHIQARQSGLEIIYKPSINTLETNLSDVYMNIDRAKLTQVVRNYISNALKFTPAGGSISVSAEIITHPTSNSIQGQPKQSFRVTVTDTGHGISKENLPKIFKDIVQFDAAKLQNGGGSGFGLWISKSIIDLHEGQVSVDSKGIGHGCTFTFEVPLGEAFIRRGGRNSVAAAALLSHNNISAPSSPSSLPSDTLTSAINAAVGASKSSVVPLNENYALENIRILVVDDAPLNRKMMSRTLGTKFRSIDQAVDGQEALTMVKRSMDQKEPYDLVFMDYQMPIMDGPTSSFAMRNTQFKGYIVGVTGNVQNENLSYFISKGANKVLSKPVDAELLFDVIEHRLTRENL